VKCLATICARKSGGRKISDPFTRTAKASARLNRTALMRL
jgi:hypothetical protein